MTGNAYNPLDMENLGHSVETALLTSTPTRMDQMKRFSGAGVYAIYYTGDVEPYKLLGEVNADARFEVPIYVGKAVPSGSRRGVSVATTGTSLYSRLNQHANSLSAAENLDIEDFYARWLVTEPIWIPLGESILIGRFAPVWNSIVDGFGNHDPGAGRRAGMVSRWDVLHPGRAWAVNFQQRSETREAIQADVEEYLRSRISV